MAESLKGYGKILGDTSFEFSLDGLASYSQMKKLLAVTESMAKKIGADSVGPSKEEKEELDLLKDKNKQTQQSIDLEEEKQKRSDELDKKFRNLSKTTEFFKGNLAAAGSGYTTGLTLLTTGVGTLLGALTGYADQLQSGLQRGISGGIMDFAVAAKTGGVSLGSFSKALEESGGAFASLGNGATEGAKNFGALIGGVRQATASVGNLGLSNDQLALLTAQQVKVAVAQGFKGKAAQDVVIRNTGALAKELDTLANQTGKSVLEMTQAAVKLAQDPLVSSFVRDIKVGGADAAKALNSYATNFAALFGKEGDKLARDTIGPALSGLPMIINDTGKNLALASQSTYNEIDRLAQKARNGEAMTDDDRKRLSETIKKEVAQRGQELRYMAELGGPMGESAKQFLSLAQEVESYNSAAGEQRRKEDQAAQQFNTAMNQFKANLQSLAIPFLKLVNAIPWDYFIKTLNIFVDVLSFVLRPLSELGKILSFDFAQGLLPFTASIGTVVSVVASVVAGFTVLKTGINLFQDTLKNLSGTTLNLNSLFLKLQATMAKGLLAGSGPAASGSSTILGPGSMEGWKNGPTASSTASGKFGKLMGSLGNSKIGGMVGKVGANPLSWLGASTLSYGADALKENGYGAAGSVASVGSGMLSGASTGAMIGSVIPGLGTAAGAIIGGALGAVTSAISEWNSSDSAGGLSETDVAAVDQTNKYQTDSINQSKALISEVRGLREEMGYGNSISARGVAVAETGNRQLSNLQYSGNA